jgi:DNA modification methylase
MKTEIIYCADNLKQLRQLPDECIDLIYIDPPFGLTSDFASWSITSTMEDQLPSDQISTYLDWIRPRLEELHRVLKHSGSFYVHCDSIIGPYLKVILDKVFGTQYFRSHIIVRRQAMTKHLRVPDFTNNHESILFYTKDDNYVFHQQYLPYDESHISGLYRFTEESTGRKYRLVDMARSNVDSPNLTYEFLGVKRTWKWSKERMEQAYKDGLIVQTGPDTVPALKQYLDEQEGTPVDNVWLDIQPLKADERLGYASQKPLALLDRIIKTSSNEGDIVLDVFCGSGTTLQAAQELGRHWIGVDINPVACRVASERLERHFQLKSGVDFALGNLSKKLQEIREYTPLEFESWVALSLNGALRQNGEIAARIHKADQTLSLHTSSTGVSSDKGFDFLIGDESKWIPVEAKQKSEILESDILSFRAMLRRHNCSKGIFISFKFSKEAISRITHLSHEEDLDILPITVNELSKEIEHD